MWEGVTAMWRCKRKCTSVYVNVFFFFFNFFLHILCSFGLGKDVLFLEVRFSNRDSYVHTKVNSGSHTCQKHLDVGFIQEPLPS